MNITTIAIGALFAAIAGFVAFVLLRKKDTEKAEEAIAAFVVVPSNVVWRASHPPYDKYLAYCGRTGFPPAGPDLDEVRWSAEIERQLRTVLTEVNASIQYTPEIVPGDPDADYTDQGAGLGDCEDYALAYVRRLLALNYPRGALRIANCEMSDKERWHAVLMVLTDAGAVILDQRRPYPMGLAQITASEGYGRWVAEGGPKQWYAFEPG